MRWWSTFSFLLTLRLTPRHPPPIYWPSIQLLLLISLSSLRFPFLFTRLRSLTSFPLLLLLLPRRPGFPFLPILTIFHLPLHLHKRFHVPPQISHFLRRHPLPIRLPLLLLILIIASRMRNLVRASNPQQFLDEPVDVAWALEKLFNCRAGLEVHAFDSHGDFVQPGFDGEFGADGAFDAAGLVGMDDGLAGAGLADAEVETELVAAFEAAEVSHVELVVG